MAQGPNRRLALLGAAAVLSVPAISDAATAPRLGGVLLQRPADPYDERADAEAALRDGMARARRTGRRLLIDMGGNWCADCLVLTAIMNLSVVKAFVDQHYVVVTVDVGRFDRNLAIPARYGLVLKEVPCVIVLDAQGKRINKGQERRLGSAAAMDAQAVVDQLAAWAG